MPNRDTLGGIVHSYQRYDPARIPPPRPPQVDLVTPAMEHMLEFGDMDELTEEQLASCWRRQPRPYSALLAQKSPLSQRPNPKSLPKLLAA